MHKVGSFIRKIIPQSRIYGSVHLSSYTKILDLIDL
jgi:hypothetical protein